MMGEAARSTRQVQLVRKTSRTLRLGGFIVVWKRLTVRETSGRAGPDDVLDIKIAGEKETCTTTIVIQDAKRRRHDIELQREEKIVISVTGALPGSYRMV